MKNKINKDKREKIILKSNETRKSPSPGYAEKNPKNMKEANIKVPKKNRKVG